MKILILLAGLLSFSAQASVLESFFSKLEGDWTAVSAEILSESADGELTHSVGTRFLADVRRNGNRWDFNEDICWRVEEAPEVCEPATVAYEVEGDSLFAIMEGERLQIEVLEADEDNLLIVLGTTDFVFTAVLSVEDGDLRQDSVIEFPDGSKDYQFLHLRKR